MSEAELLSKRLHALSWAAYIVEELADLFARAREAGEAHLPTVVGARFERRVIAVLEALQEAEVDSDIPPAPALSDLETAEGGSS